MQHPLENPRDTAIKLPQLNVNPRAHAAANEMEDEKLPDWKLSYRVHEAAAATGFGESTLWKKISEGKLKAKKDGGVTIIKRDEINRYLDGLPDVVPSKV